MDFYFGVDSDRDCRIDQWRRSYQASALTALHQVKVSLQLRIPSSRQLRAGKSNLWLWHQDDDVVLHPVNFIWRLANVCT